ncbi:MAG TPA: choice-of-anchor P family protein [Acidimicrobiales bacterium]|nr:choice-of-anchor P family protein [Acidimicrobiales bacterium]
MAPRSDGDGAAGGRWARLLGAAVVALAVSATGPASAGADDVTDQFGGFELLARGNGLQVTYDSPGLVPQSPAFQASIPEALASSSSGTNYALASLAYPGAVLADLSTVLAQSNPDLPAVVPPYPVRAQAFFPSGPTAQTQSGGSAEMRAVTDAASSQAVAFYAGTDVGPLVRSGSVTGNSATRVEQGRVTSRARVEVGDVDLLGGLIHAESVVTDLVAVSDGRTSASEGQTTVHGLTVLGLAATVDGDGVTLDQRPPDPARPASPLDPVLGPLVGSGTLPPGAVAPAKPVLDNLNQVLARLGPDATLTDALDASGVRLRVLEPVSTADKGAATRSAYGLQLEVDYSAAGDPLVGPLLAALVPSGTLPADCPVPGAPVDCSPEGLVSLLTRTQIGGLGIAAADVRAAATAPFEDVDVSFAPPALPPGRGVDGPLAGGPSPDAPAFSTPFPALPTAPGGGLAMAPLSVLGRALPAVLIVLLVLSAPLWATASRRLADAALAAPADGCPEAARRRRPGER